MTYSATPSTEGTAMPTRRLQGHNYRVTSAIVYRPYGAGDGAPTEEDFDSGRQGRSIDNSAPHLTNRFLSEQDSERAELFGIAIVWAAEEMPYGGTEYHRFVIEYSEEGFDYADVHFPAEESDQEQAEAAEAAYRAEQAERYAPTEEAIASAIHYASGAVGYLGAHPYAALTYLRSARELLEKAESLLIDAANR